MIREIETLNCFGITVIALIKEGASEMKDFEEIGHSGGSLEILVDGTKLQFVIRNNTMNACSIEAISVPFGATNLQVYIVSDKQGYFGAFCKGCRKYFRTSDFSVVTTCPYCGVQNAFSEFFTLNQEKYIKSYIEKVKDILTSGVSGIIDFDSLIEKMDRKSSFIYSDEMQQTLFKCKHCSNRNDIIGIYGYCSNCGKKNNISVFGEQLKDEKQRLMRLGLNKPEQYAYEKEMQEVLKNSIGVFEAFSKDVRKEVLRLDLSEDYTKKIKKISFQRILEARETLIETLQFDIFIGLNSEEIQLLNKYFNIRHLFTHNNGIVDEDYLKKTADLDLREGQLVRLNSNDLENLIRLMWNVGNQLSMGIDEFIIRP